MGTFHCLDHSSCQLYVALFDHEPCTFDLSRNLSREWSSRDCQMSSRGSISFDHSFCIDLGRVTDIRQDLSNNGRLAYILVAYRLHTKILHNSPNLFGKISIYAGDENLFPNDSSTEQQLSKVGRRVLIGSC